MRRTVTRGRNGDVIRTVETHNPWEIILLAAKLARYIILGSVVVGYIFGFLTGWILWHRL